MWNICNNEALTNLTEISHTWIKVGLQYMKHTQSASLTNLNIMKNDILNMHCCFFTYLQFKLNVQIHDNDNDNNYTY